MALDCPERGRGVPNTAHTHSYDSRQVSSVTREKTEKTPFGALKCPLV